MKPDFPGAYELKTLALVFTPYHNIADQGELYIIYAKELDFRHWNQLHLLWYRSDF